MNIFWFIPLHGDGRYLGTSQGARAVDHAYMKQIAQAADKLGYGGVLLPTGRSCEDPWISAASLISSTQRLKFLVALRPSIMSPTVAARQTATLDRLSEGRLLVNVVAGGDSSDLEADGTFLSHDERYEHAREFLEVYTRVLSGETVDFEGKHVKVKGARQLFPPVQRPYLTMNAREFLQTDVVLVGILLYAILGKLADVFAKALERYWLRWHPGYQ